MKEKAKKIKIAVIGATGAVGREMLEELTELELPSSFELELEAFASARSEGVRISVGSRHFVVKPYSLEALRSFDYVLMSAGGDFSRQHATALAGQGCVVIDNSSAWRMDPEVPLVVPEVNAHELKNLRSGIIANPNCSTIQMLVALHALEQHWGLEQVQVATYQSVSGSGQKGINELAQQVKASLSFKELEASLYPQPIAFNLFPLIGGMDASGHSEEEVKMIRETRKILGRPNLEVLATAVRVPVFNCHSEAISVRLRQAVSREAVIAAWKETPGLCYHDDKEADTLPSPYRMQGKPHVAVCRLRLPYGHSTSSWLQFWNVADNLKKGAATNAVQILGCLLKGKF